MSAHIRPFNRCLIAAALSLTTLVAAQVPSASRLIVLNKGENTVAIVDPATMKVVARVPTGDGPHEAAVSADGTLVVVANYGAQRPGNSLSIIDIDAAKEIRRHDLGALSRPRGMQLHGGKVYFTSESTRTVARYDIAADKVDWLMGTGASVSHMLVVSPDGTRLYTSNIGSNNVTAIRLDGPPNTAGMTQIAVGGQPEAIDISPDGRELWVGHNADGGISVIDTASNTVKETFKVGALPIRLKFSPDGKIVLVSDPRGQGESSKENNLTALQALDPASGTVIVVDALTRKIIKRISVGGVPLGIQFSADGTRAFVSRTQVRRVDQIDMKSLAVIGSVETGNGPDGLAWRDAAPR